MSRIRPQCLDSDPSDRSVPAADVLLRQEPDEEEEEKRKMTAKNEDEGTDDGYSE
jgi:hypothetical protein